MRRLPRASPRNHSPRCAQAVAAVRAAGAFLQARQRETSEGAGAPVRTRDRLHALIGSGPSRRALFRQPSLPRARAPHPPPPRPRLYGCCLPPPPSPRFAPCRCHCFERGQPRRHVCGRRARRRAPFRPLAPRSGPAPISRGPARRRPPLPPACRAARPSRLGLARWHGRRAHSPRPAALCRATASGPGPGLTPAGALSLLLGGWAPPPNRAPKAPRVKSVQA
jgi:hypothetical protein